MNAQWQEFLGTCGARFGDHADHRIAATSAHVNVADFGDLAAELVAARDATVVAPLVHLGLIGLAGDDTADFLHNQLTSDVRHLQPESAQHSAWCTAKGRMLASFLLYREHADYRALLSADLVGAMHQRLKMFVLRSRVTIADLSDRHEVIGLSGPQAEAIMGASGLPVPLAPLKTATFGQGTVLRLDRRRWLIVVGSQAAGALWTALAASACPVGTPVWHWLDIEAGLPLISAATKEEFVPQMVSFDKIGGISFNKGCYPGQEIVARTQYLGKVKRHLYRVRADAPIGAGTPIIARDNPLHPCGMVVSAAPAPAGGFVGLAVVQENFVSAGNLESGAAGGPRIGIEALVG